MKRILSVLLVLAMMISACTVVACAENAEKRTEIVVCAGPGSPITSGNFDPLQGFLVQGFFTFHSSLLKYDADLVLQNDLAVGDYEVSEDKLVYTFKIRDDAYFSDGNA